MGRKTNDNFSFDKRLKWISDKYLLVKVYKQYVEEVLHIYNHITFTYIWIPENLPVGLLSLLSAKKINYNLLIKITFVRYIV